MEGTTIIGISELKQILDELLDKKLSEKLKDINIQSSPVESIDEYLTTKQVAKKLHVCDLTIRNLNKRGLIPSHRFGRKILYKVSELEAIGSQVNKGSKKR